MGSERQSTESSTSTTPQRTSEQVQLDQLDLALRQQMQSGLMGTQQAGLDLIQRGLQGRNLPGQFGGLLAGITPEITSEIAQKSVQDLLPGFQSSGILDSGVAASVAGRTAGDIRRTVAESNLDRQAQLLNLLLGGQAQVQSPILGQAQALGGRLSAAMPTTTYGTSQSTLNTNPFLTIGSSLAQGFGQGFGSGMGTPFGNYLFASGPTKAKTKIT